MPKWIKTNFPGVRYREHESRKNGVRFDQYFTIRYKLDHKDKEESLGWASQGWTASKAYARLLELKENKKVGEGPQTLAEKRDIENQRKQAEVEEKKRTEIEKTTFKQHFDESYYPDAKTYKKDESYRKEEEHFRLWIEPEIGRKALKDIGYLDIQRIKKKMLDAGKSPRYIQYVLATLRQTWNSARRDGLVSGDCPTKSLKMPKFDNKRLRFLTHEEAEELLTALKARSIDVYHMALLSLHCGAMAGEIFSLQWADVDNEAKIVTLRDTKNSKTRHCVMTGAVKEMFTERGSGKKNDLVFPSTRGTKITGASHTFALVVKELKLNEGIDDRRHKVVWHSLRHTYASWLVQNGVSLYVVQRMLGHSQISQTERYSHLHQDTITDAVKVFEAALKQGPQQAGKIINLSK